MKLSELALAFGLLACCALLPVLLAGGFGAVAGLLTGSLVVAGSGLVLVLLGAVLWLRRSKTRAAARQRK